MHALIKQHAGIFLRGLMVGVADLIPGVSGGTIAFITGIYARLLKAVKLGSSPMLLLMLLRGNIKIFWKTVDGTFIAVLLSGILVAIFATADLIHLLLSEHTEKILAFFLGLTISAAWWMGSKLPRRAVLIVYALVGLAISLAAALLAPVSFAAAPPAGAFFIAGAVALCAMILPGISGSLLLLILGFYPHLIEALHARDLAIIAVFGAGGVLGLALFARLLTWVLQQWHDQTIALLVGVMLGATVKLWPWKQPADGVKVILQDNILPTAAAAPSYAFVIVLLLLGAVSVIATERVALKLRAAMQD